MLPMISEEIASDPLSIYGIKFPSALSIDSNVRTPPANKQNTTWLALRVPEAANNRPDGRMYGAAKTPAAANPVVFIKFLLFMFYRCTLYKVPCIRFVVLGFLYKVFLITVFKFIN